MKNPNTGKTFLDIDDINLILPKNLILNTKPVSRSVFQAKDGTLISISNSRTYDKGYLCWYYAYADRYFDMGVRYMLFTIGIRGLVLVPMDEIQKYKIGCYWKTGKNRGEKRYRFDVKVKQDNSYEFINSSYCFDKELCIKHNHMAVKHSRIAKTLDFGSKWYGMKSTFNSLVV